MQSQRAAAQLRPALLCAACRVTRYLTENGFSETWDFFDSFTWYPLGRVVGGTMYPGAPARPPLAAAAAAAEVLHTMAARRFCRRRRRAHRRRRSLFAGLIFTAGAIWNLLQWLHIPIHVQEVRCV